MSDEPRPEVQTTDELAGIIARVSRDMSVAAEALRIALEALDELGIQNAETRRFVKNTRARIEAMLHEEAIKNGRGQ